MYIYILFYTMDVFRKAAFIGRGVDIVYTWLRLAQKVLLGIVQIISLSIGKYCSLSRTGLSKRLQKQHAGALLGHYV